MPVIQKIEPYQQPPQPYIPPMQQPVYQPPPQLQMPPPYQLSQSPPPLYAPPGQPGFYPPMQPHYALPPGYPYPYQPPPQPSYPPGDFTQPQQPILQQPPNPPVQGPSPQGRGGGQPRQGQASSSQQAQDPRAGGNFFDRFGEGDNARDLNNRESQARRFREELDQQVREKQARKEAEKIEKEKWEQKYGEGSWHINAGNPTIQQQQPGAPQTGAVIQPGVAQGYPGAQQPFPTSQQLPGQPSLINPIPTQQPGAQPTTGQPNQPHSHIQVHQLPGGGHSVAHGAVPDSSNSPPRTQNQVDAYKNELMLQIEEKKKKQDAEKKRKLEEDEKEEMRVKKEMDELNKRYQREINPDVAEEPPKPQTQEQEQQPSNQERNGTQGQDPIDQRQERSRRGGPQQRRQQPGFSRRGPPQQSGPNRNNQSQQDNNGYYAEDSRPYYDERNHPQDDRGGEGFDQYQDYGNEYYQEEGGQNRRPPQPRNQQRFQSNRNQRGMNNNNQQDQYYQENDPYYDEVGFQDQRFQNQRGQNHPLQRNRNGPQLQQQMNDGPPGPMMGDMGMGPPPNMMPGMMPLPPMMPPVMPNLDPLKMQLQSQFSNFQKDIMRLQHQQKQMMRNYHKEIEMLQRKKQQIMAEMKNDQDAQMKMQIQQLSYAIQALGEKMGRRDLGLPQSLSPQKGEIVAEVINELRNVLPIPQGQQIQYKPMQFSQSLSPPPTYQIYQDDLYSELPPTLQNKAMSFVHLQKNSLPQYINQKPQNADFQLPSTTLMMPHDSPRYQQQAQSYAVDPYYQEAPPQQQQHPQYKQVEKEQSEPVYRVTKAKDPRARQSVVAAPPPPQAQEEKQYVQQPPEQTMIFNPNAPVPGNRDGVYPDIPYPEIEDHTTQLKEKAQQIHSNPKSIDPRSQLKTSQQPRGVGRKPKIDQASMDPIPEESNPLGPNIGLPHELPNHSSKLKQKAKQLKDQNALDSLPPEEAIKNIQKSLLMPYSDSLDKINEEEDEGAGTVEASPVPPQSQESNQSGRNQPRLEHKPSITSLIRDSARQSVKNADEKEPFSGQKEGSAGEETPPPVVKHPASLRLKKQPVKELEKSDKTLDNNTEQRPPQQQQRMSIVDQIRYKNQGQTQQNLIQNPAYPQMPNQNQIPRGATRIDQRQRISLINQDSEVELQTLSQQIKVKKPFEMKPQKPYIPAPTPYGSNQHSQNTYFISSDTPAQSYALYQPAQVPPYQAQVLAQAQAVTQPQSLDWEQVQQKSLHLVSSNLSQKSLTNALDSLNRQEQSKQALEYKAMDVSRKAIFESMDSLRRQEEKLDRASNQVTNQALVEALDSIRRLQSEIAIQESQAQMDELRRAQEQIMLAQQYQEQQYAEMIQIPQQMANYQNQRQNKIDQKAVNDALNSIRQVQATLEARNLLSNNPPQFIRGSQPLYVRLQEERQQIPTIQSRVSPQQLSPKLETQVFSPVGQQYINLTEDEYNQEINDQYSQNFESDNNQALIQSQYYVSQPKISPKMYQEAPNIFGARGMESQGTLLDDQYFLTSQQNVTSMYGPTNTSVLQQTNSMQMQQSPSNAYQRASFNPYQPQFTPDPTANLQVDPLLFKQNIQGNSARNQNRALPPPPTQIQPVVPDYAYDEEFVHYAKEESVKNPGDYTPKTNELASEPQSQFGKHSNLTPQNLIINVAPPEEEMQNHNGYPDKQEGNHEGGEVSPQKQSQIRRGAPRTEDKINNEEQVPKVQSYSYNINPKQISNQQQIQAPKQPKQIIQQALVEPQTQQPQSKQVIAIPPWRLQTSEDADRTPLPVDVPPIQEEDRPIESRQTAARSLLKSRSEPPGHMSTQLEEPSHTPEEPGYSLVQGPITSKKPPLPKQQQEINTEKYNYQPEGPQYNLENTQNILAQDLLYQQLQNYERQHMLEMQEYIKQQEELKKLEEKAFGNVIGDADKPGPLVFPDFTNFLYNKFLINGAPQPIENQMELQNREDSMKAEAINISSIVQPSQAPLSARAKFADQLKNAPQFSLHSSQAVPELEKPPTRLILDQIKHNKQMMHHVGDGDSPKEPVRIIPHTPSLMMRPVTHAAPRPLENKEEEQEQFKVKVEEIQQMVDKYERIKKEVEFERMEQEKRQVNQFGQEYMKSLKQVESMVRDKDEERWRKKMEQSINIGTSIAPPEDGSEKKRQGISQQGFRPKFGQKIKNKPVEYSPQDPRFPLQPVPESNNYVVAPKANLKQPEYNEEFQNSYNQSDELNIADPLSSSNERSIFQKTNARSENHSPQHQKVVQARAEADLRGPRTRVGLPSISMPSHRPMTGQTYLRDMMQQIPTINNPNAQQQAKPPLPPISLKQTQASNQSRNLENSGYIPKHLSQQSVYLPPIQRSNSVIEDRESEKSVIDIFNPTLGRLPNKQKRALGGSMSELFQQPQSARRQPNGNDPFSIRDRLRQTLQDTAQMMRIDNVNLLQKIKEYDRTIKPSSYEQGLPPIIDIADKAKQSAIQISNAPNQNYVEDPVDVGQYQGFDPANFPTNYQDWEAKRQVAKHKEDRYNMRGSLVGDQSLHDNQLVKEIIQSRNQPLNKNNSSIKLQPLPQQKPLQQSSSAKILPQSLMNPKKHMLPGKLGQNMEESIKSQPGSPSQFSNNKLSEKVKDLQPKKDEEESRASSSYGIRDNGDKIQYRVVEHTVETPRELLGRSGSSQVILPTISQSQDPGLFSGNSQPNQNFIGRGGLSPNNKMATEDYRDSFVSASDQTVRNVQLQRNIEEIPDQKSAREWVSHWLKDAPRQSTQNSPSKDNLLLPDNKQNQFNSPKNNGNNFDPEKSVDQISAKKYLSGLFNLGGSQQLISQNLPKIIEPATFRPTTPAIKVIPPIPGQDDLQLEKSVDQYSAKKYLSGLLRTSK